MDNVQRNKIQKWKWEVVLGFCSCTVFISQYQVCSHYWWCWSDVEGLQNDWRITERAQNILCRQTCISFIALSSVNIVQCLLSCSSVIIVGTSRMRILRSVRSAITDVSFRSSSSWPVSLKCIEAEVWLVGIAFPMTVSSFCVKGLAVCNK
jgi:hypothetical protein